MYNVNKKQELKTIEETESLTLLESASSSSSIEIRRCVAEHYLTSTHILNKLSLCNDEILQTNVANNYNTSNTTLTSLLTSVHLKVILAVLDHLNFSTQEYAAIFNSCNDNLRRAVLSHYDTPNTILESQDLNYQYFKEAISLNPKLASLSIDFNLTFEEQSYRQYPLTIFHAIHEEDYPLFIENFKKHHALQQSTSSSEADKFHAKVWMKKHIHFFYVAQGKLDLDAYYSSDC